MLPDMTELLQDAEAPAAAFVSSAIQGEAESLVRYTIFAPDDAAFATTFPGGIDDPDVFYGVCLSHVHCIPLGSVPVPASDFATT